MSLSPLFTRISLRFASIVRSLILRPERPLRRRRLASLESHRRIEPLEERRVLAVAAVVDGFDLTVTASGASDFTVSTIEDGGRLDVQVFDNNFNRPVQIVDPDGNPEFITADTLSKLTIIGGELQNTINVDASPSPPLTELFGGKAFTTMVSSPEPPSTVIPETSPSSSDSNCDASTLIVFCNSPPMIVSLLSVSAVMNSGFPSGSTIC
ncbi:MAG: hypothetical protein AAGA03_18320, partial [Planctomycetota bacterium]